MKTLSVAILVTILVLPISIVTSYAAGSGTEILVRGPQKGNLEGCVPAQATGEVERKNKRAVNAVEQKMQIEQDKTVLNEKTKIEMLKMDRGSISLVYECKGRDSIAYGNITIEPGDTKVELADDALMFYDEFGIKTGELNILADGSMYLTGNINLNGMLLISPISASEGLSIGQSVPGGPGAGINASQGNTGFIEGQVTTGSILLERPLGDSELNGEVRGVIPAEGNTVTVTSEIKEPARIIKQNTEFNTWVYDRVQERRETLLKILRDEEE